jgi:hypothetical protein
MIKRLLVLLVLMGVNLSAESIDTSWVREYNGPANSVDYAADLAVDAAGNVYVTGYSLDSLTQENYTTIKYDPDGNEIWVKSYDGPIGDVDRANSVALDFLGNIYVSGYSSGITPNLKDFLTIKYYPNGDTAWVRRLEKPANDYPSEMTVDSAGNCYITGRMNESFAAGTVKYFSNGDTAWVREYGVVGIAETRAIAVDNALDPNVYVGGRYADAGEDYDLLAIKYDANGDTAWVGLYDGPAGGDDRCWDLAVDLSGNVYALGYSENLSGEFDIILVKYNSTGVEQYVGRITVGETGDGGLMAVTVDSLGNCYICGRSPDGPASDFLTAKYLAAGGTAWLRIFDISSGDYPTSIDVDDDLNVYVAGDGGMLKYDADGNLLWSDDRYTAYRDFSTYRPGIFYATGVIHNPSQNFNTVKYHISKFDYVTNPTQNEINVPVDSDINVTFPIAMIPGTIMDTTFVVNSQFSGRISGYITYNSDTRTATFDPDSIFKPGEEITVVLTKGIYATEGGALDESYSWSFTTEVDGGFGNFIEDANYEVTEYIYNPVAFYFDSDEWIDIGICEDSLYILENDGSGGFGVSAACDISGSDDLVAADLNGDGCMDLASVYQSWGEVSVFLNGCDGTMIPFADYGVSSSLPITLTALDVEGDGDMDLAAAGDTGAVSILINNGSAVFSQDMGRSFDAGGTVFDLEAADLNNDGFMDLMILDWSVDVLKIFLNDSIGNFTIDSTYALAQVFRLAHADFNDDGFEDIVITPFSPEVIYVLLNDGNGQFSINSYPVTPGSFPFYVTTGDFDHDDDMDIIVSNYDNSYFTMVPNNGDGSFGEAQDFPVFNTISTGIQSADVDNDGDLDIITSDLYSGYVTISLNERAPTDYFITPVDTSDLYYVQIADLDRDNYLDVAYTGSVESGLFVAYGDTNDILTEPIKYLDISQAALNLQYFNEDSLLDIIAVTSSNLYILENLGNRAFDSNSVPLKSYDRDPVPAVATGLLNDDLAFDIVYAPDQVQFGDGYGGFLGSPTALAFSFAAVSVGDFDYDGLDDLLVTDGDYVKIYINLGAGTSYSPGASELLGAASLEVPPTSAVTDFNRDRQLDFALVQPMASPPGTSKIFVGLGDGTGDVDPFSSIEVSGIAYDLVVCDVNRDVNMDIVIANGTDQRIEIYYGEGDGNFSDPEFVELPAGTDMTYILSTIDLNRDGLPDYISGGPDGDYMNAVIDEGDGSTETLDEMVVTGYTSITLEIINPDGHVISQYYQTVPGADYWRRDVDEDGYLDEESYDYNLQYGEYIIIIRGRPGSDDEYFDVGVRVDGTTKSLPFLNYNSQYMKYTREDSLVFYFMVETESSIQPGNGIATYSQPIFDWSELLDGGATVDSFQIQLDCYYDFRSPIYDINGLIEPTWSPPAKLGLDSVFYWHFRSFSAEVPSEYSRTFAAYIAYDACGDANADNDVNVSDAVYIINYVFVGGNPPDPLSAADVNCDATVNVSDAVWIINYVFVGGNNPCDTTGDGIPDC